MRIWQPGSHRSFQHGGHCVCVRHVGDTLGSTLRICFLFMTISPSKVVILHGNWGLPGICLPDHIATVVKMEHFSVVMQTVVIKEVL